MTSPLEPDSVVAGTYRVDRLLGRGGSAEVYRAVHMATGAAFALKVRRRQRNGGIDAAHRLQLREAASLQAISTDEAVWIHEVANDPHLGPVLVLELLAGESLLQRLNRRGPMPLTVLHPIVLKLLRVAGKIHARGFIHGCIKPSDVFLQVSEGGNQRCRVRLIDFDQSRRVGYTDDMTERGQSLGAFSFMAPEQIRRRNHADQRSDLYAVAMVAYQALSGRLPYVAKNILQMVDQKAKGQPARSFGVLMGGVVPALEAFFERGLTTDPDMRYQTATEAFEAWRAILE